jgi:riboflavin synthase
MFTGIIEEKGRISRLSGGKVFIQSHLKLNKGDSIAVQGICLTVTDVNKNGFIVEAMKQTKGITTLSDWRTGNYVNLERALRFGDRIGGHILLGHIDEVGKFTRIKRNEYYFQINLENSQYLISKGSIGIDGVSLTIGKILKNVFSVSLIPYTLNNTTLANLKVGSSVNIEYDYLVKILKY